MFLEEKHVHLEILSSLSLHKHTLGTMHVCAISINLVVVSLKKVMFSMEFGFIFSKYLDNRS